MLKKDIKFDCINFDGARPCRFKTVCHNCHFYKARKKRILIIKFASAGDVLRTTAILPAIRNKYPNNHLTWLVHHSAKDVLVDNRHIDRILIYNLEALCLLMVEEFDLVISLDKAKEAAALASLVKAGEKYGFGLDKSGVIYPFNKESEYAFSLGLDNNLKFRKNKLTYQETIFDIAKLKYKNERPQINLSKKEREFADHFLKDRKINKRETLIGINTGAGNTFANKFFKPNKIIALIKLLNKDMNAKIVLFGGPGEEEINKYISKACGKGAINAGCRHNIKTFSALINRCSVVVSADTLALHIAVSLKVPVVALFGPTCPEEINLYKKGIKIVSDISCAPCYKKECSREITCMDRIGLNRIKEALKHILGKELRKKQVI